MEINANNAHEQSEKDEKFVAMEQRHHDLLTKLADVESRHNEETAQLLKQISASEEARQTIQAQHREELAALLAHNTSLSSSIDQMLQRFADQQAEYESQLQQHQVRANSDLGAMRRENQSLSEQLSSALQAADKLQANMEQLQRSQAQDRHAPSDTISSLESSLRQATERNAVLEGTVAELKSTVELLASSLDESSKQQAQLQAAASERMHAIQHQSDDMIKLEAALASAQREIKNEKFKLQQQMQTQNAMFSAMQLKSAQSQQHVAQLEDELRRSLLEQKDAAEKLIAAKARIDELEVASFRNQVLDESSAQSIEQLSTALTEQRDQARAMRAKMEGDIASLSSQLEKAASVVSDQKSELLRLTTDNQSLASELQAAKGRSATDAGLLALCRTQESKIMEMLQQQSKDESALVQKDRIIADLERRVADAEAGLQGVSLEQSQRTSVLQGTLQVCCCFPCVGLMISGCGAKDEAHV
jgi:chromosome segregation ATPase